MAAAGFHDGASRGCTLHFPAHRHRDDGSADLRPPDYFAARYRHRPGVPAEQIEGSTALEITWSAIPLFVLSRRFSSGYWVVYFKERTPPADATEVYVVAKQWMWKVEHAEGQREIDERHVPVGRDVKLIMTSQDVIHSFYIPAFRVKQDVLPGRYTVEWFRATKPGCITCFARSIAARSIPAWWARSSCRNRASMKLDERRFHRSTLRDRGEDFCRTRGAPPATAAIPKDAARISKASSASQFNWRMAAPLPPTKTISASAFWIPGRSASKGSSRSCRHFRD